MTAIAINPETPPKSFRDVWLITLGHSLTHWYPATFYVLLPLIANEFGLTYAQIGFVMTCHYVVGAIANIPGGMLVDTIGKKGFLMAVSLFWIGFPYALLAFTSSYWMLVICVALVGIGNNLWHPTAIPALANQFPDRKGLVLSVHGMGGNVGDALAPLVVGALLVSFGWRELVIANLIPGIVVACLLAASLGALRAGKPRTKAESTESTGSYARSLGHLLRNRSLVLLSASSAFRAMTQSALLTFLPLVLAHQMGYSPFLVGVWLFVLQAAGFVAAPVAGHLSDRVGRRRIIAMSMAMTAVVLLFMALAGSSHAFVIFIAVLGFFLYAVRPVLQAWLLEVTPKHMGGTSIGILFGTQSVGSAIGPIVCGLLADRYGLSSTFYFLAASIVVANLFVFGMRDAGERQPALARG